MADGSIMKGRMLTNYYTTLEECREEADIIENGNGVRFSLESGIMMGADCVPFDNIETLEQFESGHTRGLRPVER